MKDFPRTRYQGSKLKVASWIWEHIEKLDFETALEAFGGTSCISYLLKLNNKKVTYNDVLRFNYHIATALVENSNVKLDELDMAYILRKHPHVKYENVVAANYKDIFYTDEENEWIDMVTQNIHTLENVYKKNIALFALYQSCIIKRPYNLFHRKNLYVRLQNVKRSFGNKATWDTPFEKHFRKFVREANHAVFDNHKLNKALNKDVFSLSTKYDLVYVDTPYINSTGAGVDYFDFYNFLEGLANYNSEWVNAIDTKYKHKPLKHTKEIWCCKNKIYDAFHRVFEKFKNSILVVSYRSDGIPSEQELVNILKDYKQEVALYKYGKYKYALSTNHESEEILLIGV